MLPGKLIYFVKTRPNWTSRNLKNIISNINLNTKFKIEYSEKLKPFLDILDVKDETHHETDIMFQTSQMKAISVIRFMSPKTHN